MDWCFCGDSGVGSMGLNLTVPDLQHILLSRRRRPVSYQRDSGVGSMGLTN
jgi:hypothetical protein